MKRLLSLILVAALFLGISYIPAAHAVSPAYQHSDPGASVLTPEPLKELLGASVIDRVEYSYALTPVEENPDSMLVTLDFVLYVGDQPYYASATGDIDRYELPSGKVLWEGPTRGTIRVNGVDHSLMAGVAKLDGQEAVQISLTIQPQLDGKQIDPILVSFGKTVFNAEVGGELQAMTKDVTASVSEPAEIHTELPNFAASPLGITLPPKPYDPPDPSDEHPDLGPNGEWKYQNMATTFFTDSTVDGLALLTQAYFYPGMGRLAITTSSYCNNVRKHLNAVPGYTVTTVGISDFTVSLRCFPTDETNAAIINGIEYYQFNTRNIGKLAQALRPLFNELLSYWNVPTSTIDAMYGSLTGCIDSSSEEVNYVNYRTVTIKFGLAEIANFDSSALSSPIVFSVSCPAHNGGYIGNSPFTATVQLTYRALVFNSYNNLSLPFYYSAQDGVMDLRLNLK